MDSDDEVYKTCKHEGVHCLRALATGQRVLEVDIQKGQTRLMWGAFAWELPRLVREDPLYAEGLVKAVIGTCSAPALAAREPLNINDEAAYRPFLTAWPRSAQVTRDALYKQAILETRAWLHLPETGRQVRKMAERLFVHRDSLIDGELLARIVARVTAPPPAPRTAAPLRPAPAPARKKTGLDIQYEWYLQDLECMSRSLAYAKDKKPSGRYGRSQYFEPRFLRPVA